MYVCKYISQNTTQTILHFNCGKMSQSFVYTGKIFRNNVYITLIFA